jgi:hypothetical protein
LIEELLQFLVAIVDAELFKTVHCEIFKAGNVQNSYVVF